MHLEKTDKKETLRESFMFGKNKKRSPSWGSRDEKRTRAREGEVGGQERNLVFLFFLTSDHPPYHQGRLTKRSQVPSVFVENGEGLRSPGEAKERIGGRLGRCWWGVEGGGNRTGGKKSQSGRTGEIKREWQKKGEDGESKLGGKAKRRGTGLGDQGIQDVQGWKGDCKKKAKRESKGSFRFRRGS